MQLHVHACIHTYVDTHIHTYIHTHMQTYLYTFIHMYTYMHTHTHTHTLQYIQDEKGKQRDLFLVFSPNIEVQLPVGFPLTPKVHIEKVPAQVTLPPHCHLCKVFDGCKGTDEYCSLEHGWCDLCNPPLPPGKCIH